MPNSSTELVANPLVSVCIITYRHGRFIRQCVESALAQQTDFPFEIVIGEDESDDGTRETCLALAAEHPGRVRVLLHRRADVTQVDGRPRGTHNFVSALAATRGEFVAVCEGDDYWTDPQKLALQVSYLRANPDCVGCFHEASVVDHENRETQAEYFKPQVPATQEKYDRRDCLGHLMSKYATCSLMYRREAFVNPPSWYLRRSSDFFFDLVITRHGKLGFIDRRMAAYRRHSGGVWSSQPRVMQFLELLTRFRMLLSEPEFFPEYREELMTQMKNFEIALALQDDLAALKSELATVKNDLVTAQQSFDAERKTSQQLTAEKAKLMAFVAKQHAVIQSYEQRVAGQMQRQPA